MTSKITSLTATWYYATVIGGQSQLGIHFRSQVYLGNEFKKDGNMINLLLSFIVVLFGAAICFYLLYIFGVAKEIASAVAASIIAAITHVHNLLEKKEVKLNLALLPETIVPIENYTFQWKFMLVYSSAMMIFVFALSNAYAGFISGIGDIKESRILLGLTALPLICIGSYFVGRWTGARCDQYGILVIVIAVLVARLTLSIIDLFWLNQGEYEKMFGRGKSLEHIITQIMISLFIFGSIALIGYWRGRKTRLARYIGYLLRLLPPDTRSIIANLTYEEARRIEGK